MKPFLKMIAPLFAAALIAAGCASSGGSENSKDESKQLTIAYVAWDSEIASTHVIEYVLEEKLGYDVQLLQVDAGPMWTGVSDGSADAMVAAWLPSTHQSYYAEYEGKFEDLGPNLEGTRTGLVVPAYMDISSIEDLLNPDVAASVDSTIIGIEPGAGIMIATEAAFEEYGLEGWTLLESSSAAMAAELKSAYDAQRPVIVTGWTPHWKFNKMDLKYLNDPKNVYGGVEAIHTIVRQGLKDDHPDAYKVLDQFYWTPEDMEAVMADIEEGMEAPEAAKKWADANPDKVNAWLEGVESAK